MSAEPAGGRSDRVPKLQRENGPSWADSARLPACPSCLARSSWPTAHSKVLQLGTSAARRAAAAHGDASWRLEASRSPLFLAFFEVVQAI